MTHERLIAFGLCGRYSCPTCCSFVFLSFCFCVVTMFVLLWSVPFNLIRYRIPCVRHIVSCLGSITDRILSMYLEKYDRLAHSFYNYHGNLPFFIFCCWLFDVASFIVLYTCIYGVTKHRIDYHQSCLDMIKATPTLW